MLCISGTGAQEHGVCDMSALGSDEPPTGEPLEQVPQASTFVRAQRAHTVARGAGWATGRRTSGSSLRVRWGADTSGLASAMVDVGVWGGGGGGGGGGGTYS